jgi:hypothetical protein
MSLQRISLDETTLSIHLAYNGALFTVKIGHPLLAVLDHLKQGSWKTVSNIDPLYIVEGRVTNGRKDDVLEASDATPLPEPELLARVKEGLDYFNPELCEEGVNGTYFMKDKNGQKIAVFKPMDEEGRASPKKDSADVEIVNRGILDGEGVQRELAAYLLDKDHFSGVPQTFLVDVPNFQIDGVSMGTKTGSLQEFVENVGASWDVGPGDFPVHEVHKIGVLDLRIFNNDRHGGNVLLKEKPNGEYELVPIDHGLSLSPTLEHGWFDWLMWPQAKQPFDDETKSYIQNIDIEADVQLLMNLGVRLECIQTMKISTTLLKQAAAAGLTLYTIGSMASRTVLEEPSDLEKMVAEARRRAPEADECAFYEALWRIMADEIAARKKAV